MGEEITSEAVYVAPLKNFSRDLKIHFSAGLLHQATDEKTVEFLHQLIQEEDHGALLIPSALRAYYPLIAATNNIRVKPLHLLNLVLTLRPFMTGVMVANLKTVTPLTDKSKIRKMLAKDFTSDTRFDSAMEFDCLLGFESRHEEKDPVSRNWGQEHIVMFLFRQRICWANCLELFISNESDCQFDLLSLFP